MNEILRQRIIKILENFLNDVNPEKLVKIVDFSIDLLEILEQSIASLEKNKIEELSISEVERQKETFSTISHLIENFYENKFNLQCNRIAIRNKIKQSSDVKKYIKDFELFLTELISYMRTC